MKMKIGRHFEFDASHSLPQNEIYGPCGNLHGHRYELVIEVCGEMTSEGWICNFSDVKKIVNQEILEKFDHAHLNDYINVPTAENICLFIAEHLKSRIEKETPNIQLSRIKLYETSKCYAAVDYDVEG